MYIHSPSQESKGATRTCLCTHLCVFDLQSFLYQIRYRETGTLLLLKSHLYSAVGCTSLHEQIVSLIEQMSRRAQSQSQQKKGQVVRSRFLHAGSPTSAQDKINRRFLFHNVRSLQNKCLLNNIKIESSFHGGTCSLP